jgi:Tfp pilus assembly protein PilF
MVKLIRWAIALLVMWGSNGMTTAPAAAQSPLDRAASLIASGEESGIREAIGLLQELATARALPARGYLGLSRAYHLGISEHGWPDELADSMYWAGNRATQADPTYVEAFQWLADLYRSDFNHSAARQVLTRGVAANPDNSQLLALLGRNYFDTGDCGMARRHLERALGLGGAPMAHRFMGWCHFYMREPDLQEAQFRRYLELEPDDDQGMGGLVWSFTMRRRFGEAIAVADRFLEEKRGIPRYSWIMANAGEVHLFAGNEKRATELYEQALALDSTAINQFAARAVTTTLGYLYWKQGRREEADRLLNMTLRRRNSNLEQIAKLNGIPIPERWEFAYDIASVYAVRGDHDLMYRWLFRAVMAGYPAHNAQDDPLFSTVQDDPAYRALVEQARLRIHSTWDAAVR